MLSDLLTVVVLTRDRPDLLEAALESIYRNTSQPIPQVIVSDNSTRDCVEVEALRAKRLLRYVRRSGELSMFAHHTVCLDSVTTPWALLLHDDDEIGPGAFGWLEDTLTADPDVGAVIGGIEYIEADGRVRGRWVPDVTGKQVGEEITLSLGLDYRICPPGIVWNVAACQDVGGYHNSNGTANEQVLVLRLANSRGLMLVPKVLGRYRIWEGQATDLSSPEAAATILENTIQGAHAIRDIGLSPEAADQLIDYMIWWVFKDVTHLFSKHPFAVSRLCRKCELASPADGVWRRRVKEDYPALFWRPRRLSILLVVLTLRLVPGPVRRVSYRALKLLGSMSSRP